MKVLASVYACSPYDGSERAVGWNWLKELNEYHEITALTSYTYKRDMLCCYGSHESRATSHCGKYGRS